MKILSHLTNHPSQNTPNYTLDGTTASKILQIPSLFSLTCSLIVLLFNVWTLFSTIFWICVDYNPGNPILFVEVLIESVLLFEILTRFLLKIFLEKGYDNLNLYHSSNKDRIWVLIVIIVGSCPIHIIYAGLENSGYPQEDFSFLSRMLAIKFLRSFEIRRTFKKIEEILFYKKFRILVLVKYVMNSIIVLLITHIATCSWLLLQSYSTGEPVIHGQNPDNPFAESVLYFERMNMSDASILIKYTYATDWAVGALTGCNFADVTPQTLQEVILTIIIFLMGILLLAKIFSDFASLFYLLDTENSQAKAKSVQALKLCQILNIPPDIKYKVQRYYALDNQAFSQTQHFSEIKKLPSTLEADVMLALNKGLIIKTNLFNSAPPAFVLMMVRYLYPQVSMAGDYIIRIGEYANEMYFIKQGEVEILATDNKTRIAILREGAYFGEIGILLSQKRTVNVRALTFCHFEVIDKKDFLMILDGFPQQRELLLNVANQRKQTTMPQDIEDSTLLGTVQVGRILLGSPRAQVSSRAGKPENLFKGSKKKGIRTPSNVFSHTLEQVTDFIGRFLFTGKGLDFRSAKVILPNSRFHKIWVIILSVATFLNQIMVPYEISFVNDSDETSPSWITIDIILVVVYFIDIIINMNTSVKIKGIYTSNRKQIQEIYLKENFVIDLLAFLPIDYILIGLSLPIDYSQWIKLLRFIKISRCITLIRGLRNNGQRKNRYFQLIFLMILHISLSHYTACIMHMIASAENRDYSGLTMIKDLDVTNIVDVPVTSQSPFIQYVYFMYWACCVSSAGAYGDISGVTPGEKWFQIITTLFFRVYFAFYAAEIAAIVSTGHTFYTENLAKKATYDQWMRHLKLPQEIVKRVQRYNDCIWQRYRGLNENQILDDLPKSTRQEILEFLLFDMLEAVEIFPNDETGLFSNIVKDFRFLIVTKDEYIFRAGEVIEEIYFILEGEVAILDDPTQNEIAHLKHNDFFGETVIVEGANSTRTESAKAKTDVSLGVLHLSSIRSLWNKYPTLKEKMIAIAHLRKGHYKKVSETNKLSHRELTLKDLDTETRPMEFKVVLKEVDDMDAPTHDFKEEPKISAQVTDTVEDTERPFLFDISNLPIISDDEHHRPHSPQFKLEDRIGEKARIETIAPKYLDASDMPHRSFSFDSKCNLDNAIETAELKSLPFVGLKPIPILPDKQDTVDVYPTSRQSERPLEDQKEEKSDKIVIKKSRFSTKMLGEKKVKFCIMMITNLAVLFEWIYRPLALALDFVDFNQGPVIAYELLLTLIFVTNFILQLKHLKVQRDRKSSRSLKRGRSLFQDEIEGSVLESDSDLVLLGSTISVIPFQLIFCNMDVQGQSTNFFLILLQLSRLSLIRKLPNILKLDFFKKRYALTKILIIVITFVLLNHLFACIFIMLANAKSDFKTTWFTKIPAPYYNAVDDSRGTFDAGQFTIYIHALYWSCVTTSHIGVGDVSAINNGERIYTIIIMIISTFLYALFFGNFASMVEDLVPKFQKDYESNYNKVQEYTKALKLDSFMNKIHAYYSYLWQSTKGINENTLLNRLPASLKVDIFLTRFEEVVSQSKFFKNEDEEVDSKILNFFCQKCQYRVFMKNEFLITTGQEVNDIYLILEGKAEIVNYNLNSNQASLLHPGDYFGGIFTNMTQIQNIMTKGITKVAVLGQKDFLQLKETFPVWYKYIIKDDKFYKIGMKFLRNVRKCIQIRTTKNQRNQLRLPTWQTSNKDFGSENDFTSNKSDDSPGRSPARSEQMNTYPDIPKENKPMQLKDTRELQITNKFTETQAIPNAIETCVSVLYSGPSMKPEQKEGSATESQNQSKPQSPSHIQNPLIKLEDIQMVESGNIGKLSDKFQSKTPSSFRSRNLRKSERSVKNRLSTWLSGISILKDIRKRFSVPYAEPKVKTPKAGAVDPEVVLAKKESSRRHRKLQSQRSSYSNAPSFLIQEEDEDVDKDKSLRQSHSNKKKKTARLTLRKHTQFMAKSLANNFFHVVTLKRSLTQDLKRLRYYIEPNSAWRTAYEMIHTLVILYSVFAVPLMVGFDIQFGLGLILSEALIGLEQIVYIVLSARTAQFVYGILTLKQSIIWGKLWERGIWLELLAIIPFNLIFGALSISSPLLLIGILRLNRVLLVFRLPSKLASISVRYPELSSLMGVLKPTLYLAFISHFIACLFRFSLLVSFFIFSIVECVKKLEPKQNFQENFTDFLELSTAPIPNQYLISLTFILSIATTTGYRELQIYNNYERLIFMLCVCIGDVFSAVILGWFVAATSALGQKYLTMFQDIRKVDSVLQTDPIPKKIRKKATNYFKYIVDTQSHNKSPLEVLSDLLPQSMLKEMTFQQAKIFHHFPLFQEFKSNKPLLADIVANLKANIYLPHDYIISRNDYGTEAYLISEGLVHIFSPTSEKRIMGVLKEGNFFGELSVYTTTKRLVSFVAASFCVIQVLEKNVLKKILKSYPHAHFEFRLFAKERLDAYSKQSKNNQNRLSQNYTLLRMLSLRKTAGKNDVEEILKTCEVPLFMLKKNTSSKKKTVILNNLPLLRFASEEELAGTNINDEDLDASVEYYIDEDEMKFREFDTKKTTFRAQTTTKERRFSRVKKGREKRVAQSHGMEITYGIDIE